MKTRLTLLLIGCLVALAGWSVHEPIPVHADPIPEKYLDMIHKGLAYLARNQQADGHWHGDDGKDPVAMTGLVGTALLMEKDDSLRHGAPFRSLERKEVQPKFPANIRKAADWLMAKCPPQRDGLIFSGHASEADRYMQGHGLAVMFLAGALKDERDEARHRKLHDVLVRAVKYIVKAQSSRGGWHLTSRVEGHDFDSLPATVVQIQALQAAESAGIPVPGEALGDALQYVKTMLGENPKAGKKPLAPADVAAASACLSRQMRPLQVEDKREALVTKWLDHCRAEIPVGRDIKFGREEQAHYYYAQGLFNLGKAWDAYRTPMFDHLQSRQHKDGSWPAGEGLAAGQLYATGVWCTVLQLDHKSHPSRQIELIAID